jgi:hypothetical protein
LAISPCTNEERLVSFYDHDALQAHLERNELS